MAEEMSGKVLLEKAVPAESLPPLTVRVVEEPTGVVRAYLVPEGETPIGIDFPTGFEYLVRELEDILDELT